MESLLISLIVLGVVCVILWYVSLQLPAPAQKVMQIVVIGGALIWLLTHLHQILGVIAGS